MKGLGLLALALSLAAPVLAADETRSVNSSNTEGQTMIDSSHKHANTGADAATARNTGTPPEVGPGRAGGYLAAGIGVAALSGLFVSRRQRARREGQSGPKDTEE